MKMGMQIIAAHLAQAGTRAFRGGRPAGFVSGMRTGSLRTSALIRANILSRRARGMSVSDFSNSSSHQSDSCTLLRIHPASSLISASVMSPAKYFSAKFL